MQCMCYFCKLFRFLFKYLWDSCCLFCTVAPHISVRGYCLPRGEYCLYLQGRNKQILGKWVSSPSDSHFYISTCLANLTHFHSDNGGSIFPWNVVIYQNVQFHKPGDYNMKFHCCLNVNSFVHHCDWYLSLYCEKQCVSNSEYEHRTITYYQYC
jgi:hypothetical protein